MKFFVILAVIALLNSGCFGIPSLDKNKVTSLENIKTDSNDVALKFQRNFWWKSYKDENLNKLVETILKENIKLKIAYLNIIKSQEEIKLAKSTNGPFIDLKTSINRQKYSENEYSFGEDNTTGIGTLGKLGITASYSLDIFGRYRALSNERKYQHFAKELTSDWILLGISTQIVENYGYWIYLNQESNLLKERVESLQNLANMNQDGIDIGTKTLDSYLEIQKKLRSAQSDLEKNKTNKKVVKNSLNFLGGEKINKEIENILENTLQNKEVVLSKNILIPDTISSEIISSRPDVAYYLKMIDAQEERVKYYKTGFYPQFSINGSAGYAAYGLEKVLDLTSFGAIVGLGATFPIFRMGEIRSQYKIGGIQLNIFIEQYNNTLVGAFQNVNNQLAKTKEAKNIFEITGKSYTDSYKLYKRVEEKNALGLDSTYSLLYSKYEWLDAKIDYYQAEYRLFTEQVELVKALGGVYE